MLAVAVAAQCLRRPVLWRLTVPSSPQGEVGFSLLPTSCCLGIFGNGKGWSRNVCAEPGKRASSSEQAVGLSQRGVACSKANLCIVVASKHPGIYLSLSIYGEQRGCRALHRPQIRNLLLLSSKGRYLLLLSPNAKAGTGAWVVVGAEQVESTSGNLGAGDVPGLSRDCE